ncbi:MAG TPA: hypothetical protein VMO17_23900 [Terriglobia bacterium]|nr:hypothetical protein [Terriglobia bacterium]
MIERLLAAIRSADVRQGVALWAAMILAGGFDYAVNVLAGRWLVPVEYGIFISISAILQVLTYLAIAIRNVAAFYTAELSNQEDSANRVGAFVWRAWSWAWQWGLAATALMMVASPVLMRLLRLPNPWPIWAAAPALLLMFVRAVTDGSLQGIRAFPGFGVVQVVQALVRLLFAAGLIYFGFRAAGAIFALPLAMAMALLSGLWFLRPLFQRPKGPVARWVSWHYSTYTLLGLAAFAVLANMDALFVKHAFSPRAAGDYAPVVTLARMSQFVPLAIGILLLPKVKQYQAKGESARGLLFLSLGGALAPGLGLSLLYFLFPGPLVRIVFTGAYANPGVVLGLASLAATLFAGLNIWLNYSLALERPAFVYALVALLFGQAVGMSMLGRGNLVRVTLVMVSMGALGNIVGFFATRNMAAADKSVEAQTVGV